VGAASLSAGLDGFIYGLARYHGGGLTRLFKMDANGALTWGTYIPDLSYWLAQGRDGFFYGISEERTFGRNTSYFPLFRLEPPPSGAFSARYLHIFPSSVYLWHGGPFGEPPPGTAHVFFRLGTPAQFFADPKE
jgi:hypothetical protein